MWSLFKIIKIMKNRLLDSVITEEEASLILKEYGFTYKSEKDHCLDRFNNYIPDSSVVTDKNVITMRSVMDFIIHRKCEISTRKGFASGVRKVRESINKAIGIDGK